MRRKILMLTFLLVILGIGCAVVYRVFFIGFVRVPTGGMANTIIPGDQLVIKKTIGTVARGNIIIYKWPKDPSVQYVSRVVGLPGETIEVRDRIVLINGKELPEQRVNVKPDLGSEVTILQELSSEGEGPYRVYYGSRGGNEGRAIPPAGDDTFGLGSPFKIPDNHYFVMGDNRENSYDSRYWGPLSRDLITGKPTMIYWSSRPDQSGEENVSWERIFTRVK